MTLPLRPYQREAVDAVWSAHASGMRRPAAVLATGLGKTVLFAHAAQEFHQRTGKRVLVLAHRTELVEQAASKIRDVAPDLRAGIVMANMNQTLHDIVVASPQTLRSPNRRRQIMNVGFVIADECHHYAATSYAAVLDHFAEEDESCVFLGVTATMSRGDARALASVWDGVVFKRDIAFGVEHGFLVRPRGKRVTVDDLDVNSTSLRRGQDFADETLGAALSASMAPKKIAEAIQEHAPADKAVVFAPTIDSARIIAEATQEAGLSSATVNYKTPAPERRRILSEHQHGELQVVTNAMVLTEGWDNPACSTAVIARQTTSNALYIQMVGRVLRPFMGKTGALVLDVVGASERNTLQAQIDLFGSEREEDERDPCACDGKRDCPCRRDGCTEDCLCAGGKCCGCTWPELLELDVPRPVQVHRDGKLVSQDVDLFHGSVNTWLTTAGGTHFLPAGERYIAIVPSEVAGLHSVVAMHRYRRGESEWIKKDVADIGYAQAWAEGAITPQEAAVATRERSWRARKPTDAQLRLLSSYGIQAPPDALSGEISNMIAVAGASKRMDVIVSIMRMRSGQ